MKTALFSGLVALALSGPVSAQTASVPVRVFEQPYWTKAPVIEVLGRAKLEVEPNRASFSVTYQETGKTADEATHQAVDRARIAYKAIKKIAANDAQVSTSISVKPYYKQYRDKDGRLIRNDRADKVDGYNAQVSISVTMLDVAKAGRARAAALALGPERSSRMRVYLERTAKINRQAYAAAVADAAARAKLSAKATGAALGRLLVLQEGQGPCLGRWTSQPGRVPLARRQYNPPPMAMMSAATGEAVAKGRRTVRGKAQEVTITQTDIDALDLPSDRAPQTVTAQVCAVYTAGQ